MRIVAVWTAVAAVLASGGAGAWGQPQPTQDPRRPDPGAVRLPAGYKVEPVVINLSVPTSLIFDGADLIITESGWANTARPRVLRIRADGTVQVLASDGLVGPVTGVLIHQGRLFVSHRGRVSIVAGDRSVREVITGLPSDGDHQNNQIVLGPDGRIYLGQGTVTNSGVVGVDSYVFGWLDKHPALAEIPCRDIVLTGANFETENPLTAGDDRATTGAYKPFGTPSRAGEIITGRVKCGGAIISFAPDGSDLQLVAWGLRNPFGLKFDRAGRLWATSHGADVRGSRNIFNDPDYMVQVRPGAWYGWPEYFAGQPVTAGRFKAATKPAPAFLWTNHPPLTRPDVLFDSHSGINGFAFSPGGPFGFEDQAFIAMFGAYVPVATGANVRPAGYSIARMDPRTRTHEEFASNRLPGPSYVNRGGGFDRPTDVAFAPDGSLYVLDWGSSTVTDEGLKLVPQTGVVWRIYPDSMAPVRAAGPIVVDAAPATVPEAQRLPQVRNVPEFWRMIASEIGLVVGLAVLGLILIATVLRRAVRRRA